MHDLINDLAQVVARDTCFRIEDRLKDQDQYKNLKKARHSSYMQQYYEGADSIEELPMRIGEALPIWTTECSESSRCKGEVLDKLQPHKNLKELHIKGYLDTGFPTWIGDSLFSNMANLSLENCGNCASFPPLGQLPSLKKLYIKGMSVLKHVGCEFYGQGGVQPFPLLETLSFENMLEWEDCISLPSLTCIAMNGGPLTSLETVLEMGSMADDEVISANAKCKHPSLITSLSIGMIKKLELLPKWVTHGLMELKALKITSCEELKTLWKDEVRVQHSLLAFRSLQIRGCPQLVSLFEEDKDEENEGQHQQQQEEGLPCIARLEHLRIYNCEKLEKLPQLLHTFTFLQELYVYNCPSLGSFPKTGFRAR
ncbi:hypothetical protein TEA_028228 [Camellia sinensis var. sinensis]|uniref:Rx N-terminal domain-containing protein n=1 Tax=Camellia sinensis var. sinensis TaxID=542762 RepID=A0A4S4DNF9_CAMSN|nr:hypothetical protein TEA_028228 [Camellia sinensis var. sinensis]